MPRIICLSHHLLPMEWRGGEEGCNTFASIDLGYEMHKFEHGWKIVDTHQSTIYVSLTQSLHPCNVFAHEGWVDYRTHRVANITFKMDVGATTEERPVHLPFIGVDYFFRKTSNQVLWFELGGCVDHSGAKNRPRMDGTREPGKVYCHICQKKVSSNNFISQHVKAFHMDYGTDIRLYPEEL